MKSIKKVLIMASLLAVFASSSLFAFSRVTKKSAPWDMDLEVLVGMPIPVTFNFMNTTSGTKTESELGSLLKVGANVDLRVNFKYFFAGIAFSYLYSRSIESGYAPNNSSMAEDLHTVLPTFKLGARYPVADTTWLEFIVGLGGRFDNGTLGLAVSKDETGNLASFEWMAGIAGKTFLNDFISLNGGVNFHGAHKFNYKDEYGNNLTFNNYNLETYFSVGFNFL